MRLIMQTESGDGCTYSCENHSPIVFSSKEEFIITLEDKLVQIQNKLEEHNKSTQENQLNLRKLYAKRDTDSISKELSDAWALSGRCQEEHTRLQVFILGGQTLRADMFIQDGKISLPDVFTLDEYFQEVENT